jgi:hypothetical protein
LGRSLECVVGTALLSHGNGSAASTSCGVTPWSAADDLLIGAGSRSRWAGSGAGSVLLPSCGHNRTATDRFGRSVPALFVTDSIVCAPFWPLLPVQGSAKARLGISMATLEHFLALLTIGLTRAAFKHVDAAAACGCPAYWMRFQYLGANAFTEARLRAFSREPPWLDRLSHFTF